jgi:hypothetical protein
MGLLEIPYIFRDAEHMRKVLNGPVGEELSDLAAEVGDPRAGWWERGPRMLTARTSGQGRSRTSGHEDPRAGNPGVRGSVARVRRVTHRRLAFG